MEDQHPGGFPNEELAVAEKFAKLIVQECLADLEEVKVADYAHDEYDKGYDDGLTQAQETIKERFRVKP
jgi:hypothetical protein